MRRSKTFHLVRMRNLRSEQQNLRQRVHWDQSVKDMQCLLRDFSRDMGTYKKSVKSRETCPDLCFIQNNLGRSEERDGTGMGRRTFCLLQEKVDGSLNWSDGDEIKRPIQRMRWQEAETWGLNESSRSIESSKVSNFGKQMNDFALTKDGAPLGKHLWGRKRETIDCLHTSNLKSTKWLHVHTQFHLA